MEKEDEQLPLARMIAINKPSFWIFIAACFVLQVCEWQLSHNTGLTDGVVMNQIILLAIMFTGLLLNIIAIRIKDKPFAPNFMICTYFFEVAGVLAAAFLIFMPQ